ncbi:MAG: U32 family peptidase [Clostridia bacterium]|nr:U32 family peptidase [Clostridia bacterium]
MLPELLSPAGSPEALRAAVAAGADAVYIGGSAFNARINATNFTIEQIKEAADYCHKRGVRLHVTVNILILDREMIDALEYIKQLYLCGVDALICADMGLAREVHRLFPDLELHGSTQMSGHNLEAAKLMADMGFARMVTAREMRRDDIAYLCKNSPIDVEIFIHGAICVSHSGQCLMSSLIGGRSGNRGLCAQPCRMQYNGGYPLSIKDMCLATHIPEIIDMGVRSLKIEGRMKSPDYVYGVTRIYRRLLDEKRSATPNEIKELEALFSRSGFTDGYYAGKISKAMNGIRSESDKAATYKSSKKQTEAKPKEEIEPYNRNFDGEIELSDYTKQKAAKCLSARFYDPNTIPKDNPFDIVYLPLEKYDPKRANGVLLPPVIYDRDKEKVLQKIEQLAPEHIMLTNIGQLDIARRSGAHIHGDFRLNAFNARSAAALIELGMEDVILSPELTLAQIRDIITQKSVIIYGAQPLMLLEKRLLQKELRDRKNARFPIVTEGGRDILFNSQVTYMLDREKELKNAFINNRHFIFSTETSQEVKAVISAYEKHTPKNNGIRRIR